MKFYTDIFAQSWKVTKHNPVLWTLGVFILFWSDRSIDFEQVFSSPKLFGQAWSPFRPEFWDISRWAALIQNMAASPIVSSAFVLIMCTLALFVFLLMNAAHVGVIHAVSKNIQKYSFHETIQSTEEHMLPSLTVQILNKVIMYVCVSLSSVPFFLSVFGAWKPIIATGVFFLTLPLTIMVSIIAKYALVAVIVDNLKTKAAMMKGWQIFRNNIGVSIEMALMMICIFASLNVFAIVFALLVLSPVFIGASLIAITSYIAFPLILHNFAFMYLTLICTVASGAVFSAWHIGNWTVLYQKLSVESQASKTHRLLKKQ